MPKPLSGVCILDLTRLSPSAYVQCWHGPITQTHVIFRPNYDQLQTVF
jgi:hypothetical protein